MKLELNHYDLAELVVGSEEAKGLSKGEVSEVSRAICEYAEEKGVELSVYDIMKMIETSQVVLFDVLFQYYIKPESIGLEAGQSPKSIHPKTFIQKVKAALQKRFSTNFANVVLYEDGMKYETVVIVWDSEACF